MSHKTRSLEELITLQDQAIEALKQALAATQLALECLQKNRNEKGFTVPMDFTPVPVQPVPYVPYVQPQVQPWGGTPQWGQTWSGKLADGVTSIVATNSTVTLDSQFANAEQTLQNAQSVHSVAVAYLSSLQKESDEHIQHIESSSIFNR